MLPKYKKILRKKITLWFSISASFIAAVVFSCLLITVISSFYMSEFILQSIRTRIQDISNLSILRLDSQMHKKIYSIEHKDSAEFLAIVEVLNQIKSINSEIKYVYTLRKNEQGNIVFAVDSDPDLDSRAAVGSPVKTLSPGLLKSFELKKTIVEENYYTDQWGTWISGFAPFFDSEGKLEGVLGIDISVDTVKKQQIKSILIILSVSLLVALLSGIISLWISKKITNPLLQVTEEMSAIQHFNLDNHLEAKTSIVEIKEMISALENMKKSLRSFKKYVPAEIVADLIQQNKEAILEVERREISIFFSDIADFTSISEKIPPETLSRMLGIYLGLFTKTILQKQGTVDKYIGDAVMALWSAPKPLASHKLEASLAAIECQRLLAKLNRRFVKLKLPPLHTRIGLNSGEAIVGNMGYKERLSYTAIGDSVNLAARLEALNKFYGTKIIISESIYTEIKDKIICRVLDQVSVKGKLEGVKIYEIIDLESNIPDSEKQHINLSNQATIFYFNQEWDKALYLFFSFKYEGRQNSYIDTMIARCQEFKKNPPEQNWDGIFRMKEK
jgi:class 3 adenylate cyclase